MSLTLKVCLAQYLLDIRVQGAHAQHKHRAWVCLLTFLQLGESLGVVPCERRISQLKGVLLRRGVIVEIKRRQVLPIAWGTVVSL